MNITPLFTASLAFTKGAVRKYHRRRNLRDDAVVALDRAGEDAETAEGAPARIIARPHPAPPPTPPPTPTDPAEDMLSQMTLAPPTRVPPPASSTSHSANTSSYDAEDDQGPASRSAAYGDAAPRSTSASAAGVAISVNLPPAPWYLSPPEQTEYRRLQAWIVSQGLPLTLPSTTPPGRGFSWRRKFTTSTNGPRRFLVNADVPPEMPADAGRSSPNGRNSSSSGSGDGEALPVPRTRTASSNSTTGSTTASAFIRARTPSPRDPPQQTWSGVSVHSDVSLTFRRRVPSPLGTGGRTVVADAPLYPGPRGERGFYFEVLVSELGSGKTAPPGYVTTVGLNAEGSQAVDMLVERMMLASSHLTLEEARQIAEVVVRDEEETRARIRRAVTGSDAPPTPVSPTAPGQAQRGANALPEEGRGGIFGGLFRSRRGSTAPARQAKPNPPPNAKLHQEFKLSIGLATRPFPPFVLPGFFPSSIAFVYSPFEGCYISYVFEQEGGGRVKDKKVLLDRGCVGGRGGDREPLHLRLGDTIGCGYNPARGVYFTLNGCRLSIPSRKVQSNGGFVVPPCAKEHPLFPAVGSNGPCQLLCNIGAAPFEWDGSALADPWNQTFGDALEGESGEHDLWTFGWEEELDNVRRMRGDGAWRPPPYDSPPEYDEVPSRGSG